MRLYYFDKYPLYAEHSRLSIGTTFRTRKVENFSKTVIITCQARLLFILSARKRIYRKRTRGYFCVLQNMNSKIVTFH